MIELAHFTPVASKGSGHTHVGKPTDRETIIDIQGNLSGDKWVILFPFPANCHQMCHDLLQFGCGEARLQGTKAHAGDTRTRRWHAHTQVARAHALH